MNQATIIGRLGQDVEIKYTQNQTPVATLSVATTEYRQKDGEKQESTEWHRVQVWQKTAENCAKYLSKGSQVAVQGRIHTRSWEDKDGAKRYSTEIVAHNVEFLGSKNEKREEKPQQEKTSSIDDIPF